MRTLLILRHAKSSWKDPDLADHDRPLNKRGKRDAPRIGRLLRTEGPLPELIISSTARRARKTARKVADACGFDGPLQLDPRLYHSDPDEVFSVLRSVCSPDCVMIVGHNPGLEDLVGELTGAHHRMPTAAMAEIHLVIDGWEQIAPGSGSLERIWRPKELPADYD